MCSGQKQTLCGVPLMYRGRGQCFGLAVASFSCEFYSMGFSGERGRGVCEWGVCEGVGCV